MRIQTILPLAVALFFVSSCVSRQAYLRQANKVKGLNATVDQLTNYLKNYDSENNKLKAENASFRSSAAEIEGLQAQKSKLAALVAQLEKAGGGIQIPGVSAISTTDGVGLRIDDAVLFASGQATLSDKGKQTVRSLMGVLSGDSRTLRVDGHTDSDPIRRSSWASNLHLSAARALAVAQEMKRLGFPVAQLQVRGLGATKPVSQLPTEKAKNRRVELYFLKS